MNSNCRWAGTSLGSTEEKTAKKEWSPFQWLQISLKCCWNSSARDEMFTAYLLICVLILCAGKISLFLAETGNVWYWTTFVIGGFGKVAAWSELLWYVYKVGLSLHFASEDSCSERSDVRLDQLKIPNQPAKQDWLVLVWVVPFLPRMVQFSSADPPTDPSYVSVMQRLCIQPGFPVEIV